MATPGRGHTQGGQTILRTKIAVPRARRDRVARARLETVLEKGVSKGLAVVRAPAGFGKTTLVSGWLEGSERHIAWVSLDEQDCAPVRFWSYVAAAFDSAAPGVGQEALPMLAARQPPASEVVVTELLNSLTRLPFDVVLVLDDYHLVTNPAVHASLGFLLAHEPENLGVVICSREVPPLGLASLRAGSSLVELTSDSLRFSDGEIESFFRTTAGLPLEGAALATLGRVTEGWAAALQLAALTLEGAGDPLQAIRGFSGRNEYLFDYLAEEVFAHLDESVQSFLIDTAFLERFCLPLCEELLGRPLQPERLELLERQNLFLVPLGDDREWYRYHRLFREFLQAQARRRRSAAQIDEVLVAAARWFRRRSMAGEAIAYATAASEMELAADIITEFSGSFFMNSDLITMRDWIDRLPSELLSRRPALAFIYSWSLLATGRGAEAVPVLGMIETALGLDREGAAVGRPESSRLLCARAELCVLRSSIAFARFDLEEVERESRRALEYLPGPADDSIFNAPRDIRAIALFNLALVYEFRGEVEKAVVTFDAALEANTETRNIHLIPMIIAHLGNLHVVQGKLKAGEAICRRVVDGTTTAGRSPLAGLAYVGLGSILLERNMIEEGMKDLGAGVEMGRRWANWEVLLPGMLGLARGAYALGDPSHAIEIVEELEGLARELAVPAAGHSPVEAYVILSRLRAGGNKGDALSRALSAVAEMNEVSYLREAEALIWCNVLVESGGCRDALMLLERIERNARAGSRTGRLIEALAQAAVALAGSGRGEDARAKLREAVELAEPEGYRRVFLDLGTPMVRLLEELRNEGAGPKRLLDAVRGPRGVAGSAEPGVSRREVEILQSLAAGKSNQEIADGLFVSLNTVKTHLKNIYAKLEVASRVQAVVRARELGLLSNDLRR